MFSEFRAESSNLFLNIESIKAIFVSRIDFNKESHVKNPFYRRAKHSVDLAFADFRRGYPDGWVCNIDGIPDRMEDDA